MLQILRHDKNNKKALNEMELLAFQEDFKTSMLEIGSEHKEMLKTINSPYTVIESQILRSAINREMNKFNKHQGWEYFFAYWLVHKKIPKNFNPSLPTLEIETREPIEKRRFNKHGELNYRETVYNLRIYPTTTKRDIDNVFGQIKSIISPKPTRIKNRPKLEMNSFVYSLYKKGVGVKEILEKTNRKFPGNALVSVDITNIITKMRKLDKNKRG